VSKPGARRTADQVERQDLGNGADDGNLRRMRRITCAALVLMTSACGSATTTAPAAAASKPAAAPAESPKPANQDMDAANKELMAKPEQPVESIEIQHILIAFQGAPRMKGITRSKDEAKALAQKVFAEALAGGDFDTLVKQHTNDSAPGIYPLNQTSRKGMVKSFGDVGWRLKVGEVGVAVWDEKASPFGWHIIKRLK
jgi:hypothetical protein